MAHPQQQQFMSLSSSLSQVKDYFGYGKLKNLKILDVGSYDVNGNNRGLFNHDNIKEYIGCDIIEGPGVDIVLPAHKLIFRNYFNTIVSCECFEHDMHIKDTLKNIVLMLKSGGCFMFTCATTGRAEHGTRRSGDLYSSPGTAADDSWCDYYKNLTEEDIRSYIDIDYIFKEYNFSINTASKDLYFWGLKK